MIAAPPDAPICLYLPSLEGGGAERVFVQLANRFSTMGLRVQLLLAAARGPYLSEVLSGVQIVELGGGGVLRSLNPLIRHLRSTRPAALLSALDHSNIVAIVGCGVAASRTRCVISMRSVPSAVYGELSGWRKWLMPSLMRWIYPRAHRVIANSRGVAMDLVENFQIPKERVGVIYNPLDLKLIEQQSRETVDDPWLHSGKGALILGVGSLSVLKDFPTLIRAFSIVRTHIPCRLAILGEGPDRKALENLVQASSLQGKVYMPGFVGNPYAWMRLAKVMVTSSLTEGCPNALMQALACGTAVVSTDCPGGCAEILEHGRWGRLVPIGHFGAMASAILSQLQDAVPVDVKQRAADFAIEEVARAFLRELTPDLQLTATGG